MIWSSLVYLWVSKFSAYLVLTIYKITFDWGTLEMCDKQVSAVAASVCLSLTTSCEDQ